MYHSKMYINVLFQNGKEAFLNLESTDGKKGFINAFFFHLLSFCINTKTIIIQYKDSISCKKKYVISKMRAIFILNQNCSI